jgi:hypothetical protein
VPDRNTRVFERAVLVIGAIVGVVLGRHFGIWLFIPAAIIGIPYWLGHKYAAWYGRKTNPSMRWVEFLCWSNLLAWLLPPIGGFTAGATFQFNTNNRTKYNVLATIGILLTIPNGIPGAITF